MKFSILTATYNRAKYLEKLYKSIVDNIDSDYDIEWLIMDDGSSDNTEEVCKFFVNKEGLEVKYYKQENQGKMRAINNLMNYVCGDYVIECDSDDYFVENALKLVYKECKILQENNNIYALVFLKRENRDRLSGNLFPFENRDTTMFDLYFKYGVEGEKIIVFNSAIRKKYKYILEDNEKFCTESRMYHLMDLKYKIRTYNEVIIEGEYLQDGYTKNIDKIFMENPKAHYMYFKEILQLDMKNVMFSKRLYVVKHYILFEYLTKSKMKVRSIKGFLNKFLYILLVIPGRIASKRYKN